MDPNIEKMATDALKIENIKVPDYKWTEIKRDEIRVTPAQERVVKLLARDILLHDGLGRAHVDGYEYKDFELTAGHGNRLYLHTTVGMKGDEGTAAALICRTRRHMAIGPRGGLRDIGGNNPRGRKTRGYGNVLIRGGRSR